MTFSSSTKVFKLPCCGDVFSTVSVNGAKILTLYSVAFAAVYVCIPYVCMYMYVCMYVCMYMYMYMYVYVCMYTLYVQIFAVRISCPIGEFFFLFFFCDFIFVKLYFA